MKRLLVIDTETGGTDPLVHSIMSLAGVVWVDGMPGPEFEILIAEPEIIATPEALRVNGINLNEHRTRGVDPGSAVAKVRSFLELNMSEELNSKDKIALVGHNINFDVGFLKRLLKQANVRFDELFSHRLMDTATILRFLTLSNCVPLSGAGLDEALAFFKLSPVQGRHTALVDSRATAHLLTKLIQVVQTKPDLADR